MSEPVQVTVWTGISAKEIAAQLAVPPSEVLKKLVARHTFATVNQPLDAYTAAESARDLGASVRFAAGP